MDIMEEKIYVAGAMVHYGGGFVKGLGEALQHADPFNARLIKDTWPKLWQDYLITGQRDEEQRSEWEAKTLQEIENDSREN